MPRDIERASEKAKTTPVDEEPGPDSTQSLPSDQATLKPTPKAPRLKAPDTTANPELARYRTRLDEQLASRRDAKPGTSLVPVTTPKVADISWRVPSRHWIAPIAASVVVAVIAAWWFSPGDAGRRLEMMTALQQERDKVERSSRDLAAAWRELGAQAVTLADKAALDQELRDLREALKQRDEQSANDEQLLAQEREKTGNLAMALDAAQHQLGSQAAAATTDKTNQDRDLGDLRQALQQSAAAAASLVQALAQEREKADKLALALDVARRELGSQAEAASAERAKQNRELDEVRHALRQSAASSGQSLAQERDKADKLAVALDTAGRELEAQSKAASADKAALDTELGELRRALVQSESTAASYAQLLTQARERNARVEQELAESAKVASASPRTATLGTTALAPALPAKLVPNLAIDKPTSDKSAAPDRPVVAVAARQTTPASDADFARLMSRASALVGQGDIGAARAVLERAAETGSASALFALAETFDPVVLSAWGTFGTLGDIARAQDLYAKALAGGVEQAKDRLLALQR
jgi:hypothetical protein